MKWKALNNQDITGEILFDFYKEGNEIAQSRQFETVLR